MPGHGYRGSGSAKFTACASRIGARSRPRYWGHGCRAKIRNVGRKLIPQSVAPSSHRVLYVRFPVLSRSSGIAEFEYFDAAASDTDKIKALLVCVACCVSEDNQAGTIAGKL